MLFDGIDIGIFYYPKKRKKNKYFEWFQVQIV